MDHSLVRSNAELLIGPSETEGSSPEWSRVYTALRGDSAFELMPADFSRQPELARRFVDVFLAAHHQRVLAEADPATTFTADQARDCIDRAEEAISEFLSAQPDHLGLNAELSRSASSSVRTTSNAAQKAAAQKRPKAKKPPLVSKTNETVPGRRAASSKASANPARMKPS